MALFGDEIPLHRLFDEKEELNYIRIRYEIIPRKIPRQLEYLARSIQFAEIVKELYSLGWKDWLIIWAILSTVSNEILSKKYQVAGEEMLRAHYDFKEPDDFIPFDESHFTIERLEFFLRLGLMSSIQSYGFEFRDRDIEPEKIEKFLRKRFKFYDLDIEHIPFFPLALDKENKEE